MSDRPNSLLLAIKNHGTIRIGLPPKRRQDSYYDRCKLVGYLVNASHVLCSPEGELFCVHEDDLYRGPIPSREAVNWFSTARKVGKCEWNKYKILFFHPNGELYGTTHNGELHKGPQPDNVYVPWMYGQATQIGAKDWDQCEALFFHPSGDLYAVTTKDQIIKAQPPTNQDFWDWNMKAIIVGESGWLKLTHFIGFTPKGRLLCVQKGNGNMYEGFIPEDGDNYVNNADYVGFNYQIFTFLALTKDRTIRSIIGFKFLAERGQLTSENTEVLEERVYDNRKSSYALRQLFTYDKTVDTSSSFSHEHGFTFVIGASLTFIAGIPCIVETKATVQIDENATHTWSFTEENETQFKLFSRSGLEVPAGKATRVVVSVVKADVVVPYLARVKTLFGFETEVEGTWNGAGYHNLIVALENYN